ncbi:MAG: hypothetical protein WA192_08395 [Candidatus Acidiferrales bacterium]
MAKARTAATDEKPQTREQFMVSLNEDLSREHQAIIAYVAHPQVLKGAEYMNIAGALATAVGIDARKIPRPAVSGC